MLNLELYIYNMYNIFIGSLRFEWDDYKNAENIRKHSVSFEEAVSVFSDDHALESFDPDHGKDEERFLLVGISSHLKVVIVCYCHRRKGSVIRIISARKANKREEKDYWEIRR